jgi:hypothetical protein
VADQIRAKRRDGSFFALEITGSPSPRKPECARSSLDREWRLYGDGLRKVCKCVDSPRVKTAAGVLGFCGLGCGIFPTRIRMNQRLICMQPAGIFHTSLLNPRELNKLDDFEVWTENPRVGGSIPHLATTKLLSFRYFFIERFRERRSQGALVPAEVGRFISAANLGQRGLRRNGSPIALCSSDGVWGSRSSIAFSIQSAARSN